MSGNLLQVVSVLLASTLTAQAVCPLQWYPLTSGQCYRLNPINLPFDIARSACQTSQTGAELASVHSRDTLNRMLALYFPTPTPSCAAAWIGLNDKSNERGSSRDGWQYLDGSTYDYQGWMPLFPIADVVDQPDIISNDCVSVVPAGGFVNGPCLAPLCSICQVADPGLASSTDQGLDSTSTTIN